MTEVTLIGWTGKTDYVKKITGLFKDEQKIFPGWVERSTQEQKNF